MQLTNKERWKRRSEVYKRRNAGQKWATIARDLKIHPVTVKLDFLKYSNLLKNRAS